ncbi:hypothetical protein [Hymenobacter siberiensis]|uniref:hypothetical protein n=1 Tax=Hymenobacter siberiensis TaxID=2848396 RepID=UPI001C1E1A82|nr:hypothetical protein [Hymenobacter siberiensis]
MINFFGDDLTYAQPITQDGETYAVDMRLLCGITPERGEEIAAELTTKWLLKQNASDCTCPDCTTRRTAEGGEQPVHGSTTNDFIHSLDLELSSPNEILFVGMAVGKLMGKDEARMERESALRGLIADMTGMFTSQDNE